MEATKHVSDTQVKDLREDGGELFSRIFNSTEDLPKTLRKRAHLIDASDISKMSDLAFADPDSRQFLINTPEHAITSFAYLTSQGVGRDDPRVCRTMKMASLFGIEGEILDLEKSLLKRMSSGHSKVAGPSREASKESLKEWSVRAFANIGGETKKASVSGTSEDSLIAAANRIRSIEFAQEHPPEITHSLADGILKVAEGRGWALGGPGEVSDLMVLAGRACPDRELMEASIYSRSDYFPDRYKVAISGAARKIASSEVLPSKNSLLKLAFHIGKIDRELGLEKFYGTPVPDPLRSVFHHSEIYAKKVASRFRVGSGTEYSRYQVETPEFKTAALMIADLHGMDRSSVPESPDHIPAWIPSELEDSFRKVASDLGILPRVSI